MQAGIHGTYATEGSMDNIVHGTTYTCHCYTDILVNVTELSGLFISWLPYKALFSRSSLSKYSLPVFQVIPQNLSLLYTSRTPKYLQYEGFYSPLCCDVRCLRSSNACEGGHRKGRGMSSDYYMWLQETELTERNVDRLWVINLTFRSEAATRRQNWLRGDMNRM